LARRYADTAAAIAAAADSLRKLADVHGWDSTCGRTFRKTAVTVADTVTKAHQRYAETAQALAAYTPRLDEAQADADSALAVGTGALADRDAAQRRADASAPDAAPDHDQHPAHVRAAEEAEGRRRAAIARMEAAEQARDDAANAAARRIENVSKHDGLKDSFWDNFSHVLEAIANIAGAIASVAGILSLLVGWIPVIGQALAGVLGTIALLATAVSFVCHLALYIGGKGSVGDVLMDAFSLATFGIGRGMTSVARGSKAAARTLARRAAVSAETRAVRATTSQLTRGQIAQRALARAGGHGGDLRGAVAGASSRVWPGTGRVLREGFDGIGTEFRGGVATLRRGGLTQLAPGTVAAGVRQGAADIRSAYSTGGLAVAVPRALGSHELAAEAERYARIDPALRVDRVLGFGGRGGRQTVIAAAATLSGSAADWYQVDGVTGVPAAAGDLVAGLRDTCEGLAG
jgi:hypothetical protein